MQMSQEDYDTRKQKQNDGVASDEDRRLIKQYEAEGYVQSRLKREAAAREAGQAAGTELDAEQEVEAPGTRGDKPSWVAFAQAVNAKLEPAERPIADPDDPRVTKDQLIAAYQNYAAG